MVFNTEKKKPKQNKNKNKIKKQNKTKQKQNKRVKIFTRFNRRREKRHLGPIGPRCRFLTGDAKNDILVQLEPPL